MFIKARLVQIKNEDIKFPKAKFMGRRFLIDGKMFTLRKCKICGHEFEYKGTKEPAHCGRSGCEEYWLRFMQHQFMAKSELVKEKEYFGRKDVVKNILNNARNVREAEEGMRKHHIIPDHLKPKIDRRRMIFASFSIKGKQAGEL